jgi:transcriptional regulator with GAF, ATPase, and Fis domain
LEKALAEVKSLKEKLQEENRYLRNEIEANQKFDELIGASGPLLEAKKKVEQVAVTDATVLILGETGVGKELFARAVHDLSDRRYGPLVRVNCAALPSTLIESELFGHEKGAFTGAAAHRIGRFELADGGTIFLDEIGELPLDLQSKLLRVIQEGELERLGSGKTITVNIRIVAATHRDLRTMVWAGEFREDLYYRLNVFPIPIPPLRERQEDIEELTWHFAKKYARKFRNTIEKIPEDVLNALRDYEWPGNIRELENVVERAVILASDGTLRADEALDRRPGPPSLGAASSLDRSLQDVERDHITAVLERVDWRVSGAKGAAVRLDMHPNTLRSRMKKLGISKP